MDPDLDREANRVGPKINTNKIMVSVKVYMVFFLFVLVRRTPNSWNNLHISDTSKIQNLEG